MTPAPMTPRLFGTESNSSAPVESTTSPALQRRRLDVDRHRARREDHVLRFENLCCAAVR